MSPGDLAIIVYHGKKKDHRYLGVIQSITDGNVFVQYLKTTGGRTYSIKIGDDDTVKMDKVEHVIHEGQFTLNNRQQYILKEPLPKVLDM